MPRFVIQLHQARALHYDDRLKVEGVDRGEYRPLDDERSMAEALDGGHASFWLDGTKLHGGWTLHRTDIKRRDER
jgi:hypothetical protein